MTLFLGIYFIVISVIVTGFQIALALGAPLGKLTLGGKYPGVLPKKIRVAAVIQILILWMFVYIVAIKAELIQNQPDVIGTFGIWFVTLFFLFGSIMNISSPSKPERILWGPINALTFLAVLLIALL